MSKKGKGSGTVIPVKNTKDLAMITGAFKILREYKCGGLSEQECCIKLLEHFERSGEYLA